MDILLLNPYYRTSDPLYAGLYPMPLGLVSVASFLLREQPDHNVTIKDFLHKDMKTFMKSPPSYRGKRAPNYIQYGYSMEDTIKWLQNNVEKYDLIGINSAQTPIYDCAYEIINYIKVNYPDIPVVAGGANATTNYEHMLKETSVDYILRGEGENVFAQFCADFEQGTIRLGKYNRERIYNVPEPDGGYMMVDDLDTLPMPRWDLVDLSNYPEYKGRKRIVLTTSRGCPFACTFCSVATIWTKKWRCNSVDYVIQLLEHLYQYGTYFCILDDNFTLQPQRVKDICDRIIQHSYLGKAKYFFEEGMMVTHATDKELLKKMYDANFEDVRIGLESFSDKTLAYMKKPTNKKEIIKAIQNFEELKKLVKVFYIFGFRTDTIESMLENIVELSHYNIDARANNMKLYPMTPMIKEYKKAGLVSNNYDFRLSTFYTIPTDNFTFKDLRELRVILKAVVYARSIGVEPFENTVNDYRKTLDKLHCIIYKDSGSVTLIKTKGTFYGAQLKNLMKIFCCRMGFEGIKVSIGKENKAYIYTKNPKSKSVVWKALTQFLDRKRLLFAGCKISQDYRQKNLNIFE